MPSKGSEIVDIGVEVLLETEKAWKVASFNTNKIAWIPKSQAEIYPATTSALEPLL